MSPRFVSVDRSTPFLFPPSVEDWLPEDHLARFVAEIVAQLDLSRLEASYAGRGSRAYHPGMMLSILFYGYATGVFSSRRIEQATYDSIPFRYLAANQHPDHDTIASFRKRFLPELKPLFHEILLIASEMGILKLGNVSLDGTKMKANASKYKAMSWARMLSAETQLRQEIDYLMEEAKRTDEHERVSNLNIPEEISHRKDRLAAIRKAKEVIESRARERYEREKAEYDKKVARRKEKEAATGKKPLGKKPKPPEAGPKAKDQYSFTDPQSRIMPSGGTFEQAYNAQAGVEQDSMLVVECHVSQATNDKKELEPCLDELETLPEALGSVDTIVGDNGYFSKSNIELAEKRGLVPLLAMGREGCKEPLAQRLADSEAPPPLPNDATALEHMAHRLKSRKGKAIYAKRKHTSEPVFGIIKSVLGFRQFLLRGEENVSGEWMLVNMAWNIKRMAKLRAIVG